MWYNLTLEYVPQRVPRGAERVFTMGLFTKLFGTRSEREVKKLEPQVEAVMALEEPYKKADRSGASREDAGIQGSLRIR